MTDLRDMQLLAALARHKHFARAADECGISQPAFSARIRNLEASLQAPIVRRGNRFMGFTQEGEIVLKWAHKLLADADGLRQDIESAKGELSGKLRIGVVPSALTYVARLPAQLREAHPGMAVHIISLTSQQIARGLEDFTLDAGVTYLDEDLPSSFQINPIYDEHYVLLCPPDLAPRKTGEATWAEAAQVPLSLLTPDMRNRRIIDKVFQELGLSPTPVMETNAFTAALAQVATGAAATIATELIANSLPVGKDIVRLPLTEPVVSKPIGLVVAERDPLPPSVLALRKVAVPS